MRISVDCRYVRERPSGIGHYVRALVDRLPALGPADQFHFWVDPRARRPLSRASNTRETVVNAPANGLRTLCCPNLLVPSRDFDVLHAPFNILGRGVACPSVVTLHDLMWLEAPQLSEGISPATPLKWLFYRDGIVRAVERARRVIAISGAAADSICRRFPHARQRVRVIPHGIEARFRPVEDRDALHRTLERLLGAQTRYFLVVGQNAPNKNHLAVLRAFARAGLPSDVRLVLLQRLFASGRIATFAVERLDRVAESLGIARRVVFLPTLDDDEIISVYQGALALIQFSRYEGFGMPALEAMACGTPVVASNIPPLVEVLGGSGLHVPLEIPALGRALERLLREEALRAELGHAGRERSRAFDWDRSARLHLETYREAV